MTSFTVHLVFLFLKVSANLADIVEDRFLSSSTPSFSLEGTVLDALLNPAIAVQDDLTILNNILDRNLSREDVIFVLYTRANPLHGFYLEIDDEEGLKNSPFNSNRPTKIIVHGWLESSNTFWLQDMREIYLKFGDYNVICVNWYPTSVREYLITAKLTRQVGKYLAELLDFLVSRADLSLNDVHVLGHSLGAQISGFAGVEVSGTIGRITGLDPARPAFETPLKDSRSYLDSTDAKFVDIIHTCAGTLGFVKAVGHADFYPNGGSIRQPGCPILVSQYCSHSRSHEYMAESIVNPDVFAAVRCNSWTDFKEGKCMDNSTAVFMGEKLSPDVRGVFYLETNAQSPFGKGRI